MKPTVRIVRFRPNAVLPRYMTEGAAGADLYACLDTALELSPGSRQRVRLGFGMELPPHLCASIRGRSGLSVRGLLVLPGLVDSDYRGEISVTLHNLGPDTQSIHPTDRIAQMVIEPYARAVFQEVAELSETERGHGGHGSTGV